jgi:hypothetical protein
MFLTPKQESSKMPNWCKTEEDVAPYKAQYAEHKGINLCDISISMQVNGHCQNSMQVDGHCQN